MSESILIPDHTVSSCSEEDLPTMARHLYESKLALVINRLLFKDWPNEDAQLPNYTRAIEGGFQNPDAEILKVVEDSTGKIVAQLVVTHKRPSTEEKETISEDKPADAPSSVPEYFNAELLRLVTTAVTTIEAVVKDTEYLALTHFYVVPSSRGKGIASSLIKYCLTRGEREGLPIFVSSEPQNRPLLLELGFQETGHADIDLREHAPENCGFGVFRLTGLMAR